MPVAPAFAFPEDATPELAPAELVAPVPGLPLSRLHQLNRPQPHGHVASHALGKDADARSIVHLAGDSDHDRRASRQHPERVSAPGPWHSDDPSQIPPFRLFVIGACGAKLCPSGEGSACSTGLGEKRGPVRVGEGRRHGAAQRCPGRPHPDDPVAGRARRHHPHGLGLVHQRCRVPLRRRLWTWRMLPSTEVGDTFSATGPPGKYSVYVSESGGPQGDWSFYGRAAPTAYTQDSHHQVTVPLHTLALNVQNANGSPAPANVELTATTPRQRAGSTQRPTSTATSTGCPPSWWRTTRQVTRTADSGSIPRSERPAPSGSRATRRRTPPCSTPECTSRAPSPTDWATPRRQVSTSRRTTRTACHRAARPRPMPPATTTCT